MSFTFERFENDAAESGLHPSATDPLRRTQTLAADVELGSQLHPLVLALLDKLHPVALQQQVSGLFDSLSRLLGRLTLIEKVLNSDQPPQLTTPLFHFLEEASYSFLKRLEAGLVWVDWRSDQLAEVLDGTCFAIRHELRRVFEQELLAVDAGQPDQQLRTEMLRAHALLTNCFQQSYVTVAQVFDKSLTAAELFSDVRARRVQSVVLYRQLPILHVLLGAAESRKDPQSYAALFKGLRLFVAEHLHLLMYRDWAEFEGFAERILASKDEEELKPLLYQFGSYLETLIGHVRMRAVFAEGASDFRPPTDATGGIRPQS